MNLMVKYKSVLLVLMIVLFAVASSLYTYKYNEANLLNLKLEQKDIQINNLEMANEELNKTLEIIKQNHIANKQALEDLKKEINQREIEHHRDTNKLKDITRGISKTDISNEQKGHLAANKMFIELINRGGL